MRDLPPPKKKQSSNPQKSTQREPNKGKGGEKTDPVDPDALDNGVNLVPALRPLAFLEVEHHSVLDLFPIQVQESEEEREKEPGGGIK